MTKQIKLSQIFITFFVVSLCTFGGGYAMLPMLEQEVVDRREWITKKELIDLFAVAQGLPGIIGINIACLICSKICGRRTAINEKIVGFVGDKTTSIVNDNNTDNATSIVNANSTDVGNSIVDANSTGNGISINNDKTPNMILANIVATLGIMSPCVIIILLIAILLGQFREIEVVQHALAGIALCVLALILRTVIRMWKSSIKSIPDIFLFLVAAAVTIFTGISPIITILAGAALGIAVGLVMEKKSDPVSNTDATSNNKGTIETKANKSSDEGGGK